MIGIEGGGGRVDGSEPLEGVLLSSNLLQYCNKGTVSVISSDPPCKYGNVEFTMVPNKADKGFKGTVVNRVCPSINKGSLEVRHAVPLDWFI